MIIGVFLRNFKAYEGLNFSRISNSNLDKLGIFIGNNGSGKSSILEALDCFYNNKKWNLNKDGKQEDAFIAPVILIDKKTPQSNRAIDFISEYFWNITEDEILKGRNIPAISKFLKFRDELKSENIQKDYYLILCGAKNTAFGTPYFSTFDHDLKDKCAAAEISPLLLYYALDSTRSKYNFIYLPIESSVKDLLNLEHFEMQSMMEKDLTDEIDKILKNKNITYKDNSNKTRPIGIVDLITIRLDNFLETVNSSIQSIDSGYAYKRDGRARNIKASDIRDKIIEAYFSSRTLLKDKKSITELSSGEKRTALIDIAYAFLSKRKELSKEVLLAIDEPESSMHTSMSFKQFRRIADLSNKFQRQVLVTTHWYGLIPMCQKGAIHHIALKEKPEITSFDLFNIFEERRNFPKDIALKSFFDLVSSIMSIMRSEHCNWLICEGSDDASYFKHHLSSTIQNLHILPVGGKGNVVKIFKHLLGPMSENTESRLVQGKILCIIDTDPEQIMLGVPSSCDNLSIRRLQRKGDTVLLADPCSGGYYSPTAIEDCLLSQPFFSAFKRALEKNNPNSSEIFEHFKENCGSFVDTNTNLRSLTPISSTGHENLEALIELAKENSIKYAICKEYIKEPPHSLLWMKAIEDFFTPKQKEKKQPTPQL